MPEPVKAYGDTRDDGMIQLSFTLPVPAGPKGLEAGKLYAAKLGLADIRVACAKPAGARFTFFVVYGRSAVAVDLESLAGVVERPVSMSRTQVDAYLTRHLGRRVVVVGAAVGSDAHTVGIDAVMNMKGYAGDYGLERYDMFDAHNLGAQVAAEDVVRQAQQLHADAILASQVVTQKNIHVMQLTKLVDLIEAEGLRERVLLIAGGPMIDEKLAQELGYDAGFGRGTLPRDVATFIARKLVERRGVDNEA
ncbi:MAG: cobalamin-dependent protein [Kiritimatiellae bacterium]|nr:cobalamin-dependent protein [Kiritimatiellia bacterium]